MRASNKVALLAGGVNACLGVILLAAGSAYGLINIGLAGFTPFLVAYLEEHA